MLSDATAEKIRLVMLALRLKRMRGEIGEDEPVSTEKMARLAAELGVPLSERTFRRVEQISLARLRNSLLNPTNTTHP
jgi:hypothetical protein